MPGSQQLTSYHKLAELYDYLMEDAPYEEWMVFTRKAWERYGVHPQKIADLGCGTGTFIRYLLEHGLDVYGVDLSSGMLQVAQEKLQRSHPGKKVKFSCQDIRQLMLDEPMDCIISFCDTLNYITNEDGIKDVFKQVFAALKPGGLFIFDVHTPFKIAEIFGNEVFVETDEKVSYIWECEYTEERKEVVHKLTFFVQETEDLYRRYEECHHQRAYSLEDLQSWLKEAGFAKLSISSDFTFAPVNEESERAFFIGMRPPLP
jgi:ubiquinone/menaquinone biosynthesis C-methylase UbiE